MSSVLLRFALAEFGLEREAVHRGDLLAAREAGAHGMYRVR